MLQQADEAIVVVAEELIRSSSMDRVLGEAIIQHGLRAQPGWAMNKRTPNRRSARSFGFLGRFGSFVQGLIKCSSFVRCTVLRRRSGFREGCVHYSSPSEYQLRKPW